MALTSPTVTPRGGDLRSRRRALRVSQIALAQQAGCHWSTLRAFELGYRPAHSEALNRVVAALDVLEGSSARFAGYDYGLTHQSRDTGPPEAS